jgi:NAD(P)-dependent dehydrogenase (short-subunit alcohol dehydrogenase family)
MNPSSTRSTTERVALVAGGSRGLGLLICRELLARGFTVVACARDAEELTDAEAQLETPGRFFTRVCDIGDAEAVTTLVEEATAAHGDIDVAITVAGVIQVGPAESMTLDHFRDAVDTMLWGPVHVAWAVLPGMRRRGAGHIGTVTSVGGAVSPPHLLPYATAKFGAVGFSDGLAASLVGTGVTATTVVPGLMRTGSHERAHFTGEAAHEYAWFAPGASLPLLSMDADRAASRIVRGVLAGRPRVTLTPLAKVGIRVHGLMPATTTRVMGLVNRALPDGTDSETVEGREAEHRLDSRVIRLLTTLGTRAARRNNQR